MTFIPVMWAVWALCVLVLAVLYLYRSRISRDEEDQIFLDDSFNHQRSAQAAIQAKVAKVEPILHGSMVLAGVVTLFVVGYYALDIIKQFK
jgi:Tfp pilus assembly protein PilN